MGLLWVQSASGRVCVWRGGCRGTPGRLMEVRTRAGSCPSLISRKDSELSQLNLRVEDEQLLGAQLQKKIKELQVCGGWGRAGTWVRGPQR